MISRRLFLRNTAAAGAVGAVAAPAVAAEPVMTLQERASYHAHQLADAMDQIDQSMSYRVTIDFEHSFALIAGHKRKGGGV